MVKRFENFCSSKDLPYPQFSEWAAVQFIFCAVKDKEPFSFFTRVIPALAAIERARGETVSALTPFVHDLVNSAKRRLAATKGPTKKAQNMDLSTLQKLYEAEVMHKADQDINRFHFRAIFRFFVIYFTMCRFSDFNYLTVGDLEFFQDHIKVTFSHSKNDQYYDGSVSYIPKSDSDPCPVTVIKKFFDFFNLWGRPKNQPLNFQMKARNGGALLKKLSYSSAVLQARNLLSQHNIPIKYSEKSCKTAAVTAALEKNMAPQDLMLHGRWKSVNTSFHYRNSMPDYRLNLSKSLLT